MQNDEKVAMDIIKKFQEFESDGESDRDDLQARLDIFRQQDREGQIAMSDFIVEIKNHVQIVMDKFRIKKKALAAALRAEINYQVAVKTNKVSKDLAFLKECIAIDMKKWAGQRSDLQCDINRLE